MSRLLEDLVPGTPVRDDSGAHVGEIRAVYGSGAGRGAEFLLVRWTARDEDALVPADEVSRIDEQGVTLVSSEATYEQLPAFDPSANPMLRRL